MQNIRNRLFEQRNQLREVGYYIHYDTLGTVTPYTDCHTHGLKKSRSHSDLQIVLPVDPHTLHRCLHNAVKLIDEGFRFENGLYVDGIIEKHKIFVKAVSVKRGTLFRLIFPDQRGRFPSDLGCDPLFCGQLYEPPYIPGGYQA